MIIDTFWRIMYITTRSTGRHGGTLDGPLAQLAEQRPFKAWVTGSNPVRLIGQSNEYFVSIV